MEEGDSLAILEVFSLSFYCAEGWFFLRYFPSFGPADKPIKGRSLHIRNKQNLAPHARLDTALSAGFQEHVPVTWLTESLQQGTPEQLMELLGLQS